MERPFQLYYPVHTMHGEELLPAGTCLTDGVMADLVNTAKARQFPVMPLMDYGTFAVDLRNCVERPPYSHIFSNPARKREVFESLKQVVFPKPLLDIYGFLQANDPYTYRHILTVCALARLLAQDLLVERKDITRELTASANHDIGKICVPSSIRNSSVALNTPQRMHLSHHTAAGYVLLSYYLQDSAHPAAITARDHHERYDGSGYPRGVPLRDMVVEIVAVCDIFDALISPRPYRPTSFDVRTAMEELTSQAQRGSVSVDVVRALVSCIRKDQPPYTDCTLSLEFRGTPPANNMYSGAMPYRPGTAGDSAAPVRQLVVTH